MLGMLKRLRLIICDPTLAINRARALFSPRPPWGTIIKKINSQVNFEFDFSLDDSVKSMYYDAYEIWTLHTLRRCLKEGDVFVDVGANIGYISAYAASLVGKQGQVHCFEPVPEYYARLVSIVHLNPAYQIHPNNCALGEHEGMSQIQVTSLPNIGWNTMVNGFMSMDTTRETVSIRVQRLDNYLMQRNIRNVAMIKIDTEGFELPVIRGLIQFLGQTPVECLPILLVEVAPAAYPLLGEDIQELNEIMGRYSYSARLLYDTKRIADLTKLMHTTNLLFVPKGRRIGPTCGS